MTTIILGHSGFIGSSILKIFKNHNKDVLGISSKDINFFSDESIKDFKNILTKNSSIIMCMGIKKQYGDDLENWIKNELILKNFIKSIINTPPKHIIFFSSASLYGEDITFPGLISETTPVNLRSFYGISKFNCESVLRKVCFDYQIPLMCLRPPLIYGVNDKSIGYGPTLFSYNVIKRINIKLWGDGKEKREFIYVDDLAYLCKEILDKNLTGILNTVSGNSYAFMDILDELKKNLGYKVKVIKQKRTKSKVDHIFSSKHHKELMPYFEYTSLSEGLKQLCSEIKVKINV